MRMILVTPFVGVWIEIEMGRQCLLLKIVTPFVGVWIEIIGLVAFGATALVTPFVGVWIEISVPPLVCMSYHRHSLRGSVD